MKLLDLRRLFIHDLSELFHRGVHGRELKIHFALQSEGLLANGLELGLHRCTPYGLTQFANIPLHALKPCGGTDLRMSSATE